MSPATGKTRGRADKLAGVAPNALVYLDGTHSAWLNVGDASTRLAAAGVARTEGFFLNISNYQITGNLVQYGTWISECLAYATAVTPGDFASCPNQYWNGGPLPSLIAQIIGEWNGTALDHSDRGAHFVTGRVQLESHSRERRDVSGAAVEKKSLPCYTSHRAVLLSSRGMGWTSTTKECCYVSTRTARWPRMA